MNLLPLVRFLDHPDGTRWTVLFAGPLTRRMLPGLRRHVVFRRAGQQLVAEYDWVEEPLRDAGLRHILQRVQSGDS